MSEGLPAIKLWEVITVIIVVAALLGYSIPSITRLSTMKMNPESVSAAKAHNLAIASFSYCNDNNQTYPEAGTSTAIFQELYDGKYLTQPSDVFLNTKGGKSPARENVPLKDSNVSWDYVTCSNSGITGSDPADIPMLYSCTASEPLWAAGINKVRLDGDCPWGTEGVTMVTLSQQASFKRVNPGDDEIALTTAAFLPMTGVTYITRTP